MDNQKTLKRSVAIALVFALCSVTSSCNGIELVRPPDPAVAREALLPSTYTVVMTSGGAGFPGSPW